MEKKSTEELENILGNTSPDSIEAFLQEHSDNMIDQEKPFAKYLHQIISRNGLTQQEVFIQADFPERFGYKLLSEEKRTKQRDYILRICYAAKMTLEETQRALTLYGMEYTSVHVPMRPLDEYCSKGLKPSLATSREDWMEPSFF